MSDLFDIRAAAERILADDNRIEASSLPASKSLFEAGDRNGVFAGDVPAGVTLSGKQGLLVQGSLRGVSGNAGRIQTPGDVIVIGDVHHAQIRCRNLHVGGSVQHTQIAAFGNVHIATDLIACQVVVGAYDERKTRLEELYHDLERESENRETLDRRIHQEERRMDRSCRATRIPLNFNASRHITHHDNRVRVDLESFFKSMGHQPTDKLKMALNEFFAKGLVGLLAKANRKYITDNPAREKVFMQLLKNLRELVMLVAERELLIAKMEGEKKEIGAIATELAELRSRLHVQGSILPETQVEFHLPDVRHPEEDRVSLAHRAVSVRVLQSNQAGQIQVQQKDLDGERKTRQLSTAELRCVCLYASDGRTLIEPALETASSN